MFKVSRKDGTGDAVTCSGEDLFATCERMSHGGKEPLDILPIGAFHAAVSATIAVPPEPDEIPYAPPAYSTFEKQTTDASARGRIEAQHASLKASGIAVDAKQQLFATGTRMAESGYATQTTRKAEHDNAMPAAEACDELSGIIIAERRRDVAVTAYDLARNIAVNGKISAYGLKLTEQAIRGLATRLESPMLGYVLGLRDRIAETRDEASKASDKRKIADILQHECERAGDTVLQLRTREGAPQDIFACVSPGYTEGDFPSVARDLRFGLPRDARASFAYDAESTQWELRASVWTPTPVAEQAVGEAFEGYVSFRSRDNGTSRFRGEGGISLLRCLNASTYTADGSRVSKVHRRGILNDIGAMVRESSRAIDALCAAWGAARATEIDTPAGVSIEEAIPGFWRYCLSQSLKSGGLATILPGRKETHVAGLTEAFHAERRDSAKLVKADFAQGWTRYIQDQPSNVRRDAESAIGQWVVDGRGGFDLRA